MDNETAKNLCLRIVRESLTTDYAILAARCAGFDADQLNQLHDSGMTFLQRLAFYKQEREDRLVALAWLERAGCWFAYQPPTGGCELHASGGPDPWCRLCCPEAK